MIIKVPVYVELIGSIDSATLPDKVSFLSTEVYKIVRKHNFNTKAIRIGMFGGKETEADFRIISHEQALEELRTKK
jgi:hypothetical protein